MQEKMDTKDYKILYQLDLNCRQSTNAIGKKVGLSKQVVDYRIKRMQQKGIIRGFSTVLDSTKLGFFTFRVYLKLRTPTLDVFQNLDKYLHKVKNITWYARSSGKWDFGIVVMTQSLKEFDKVWDDFYKEFYEHIREKDVAHTNTYQFRRSYLVNKKDVTQEETITSLPNKCPEFLGDATDWKILEKLTENARIELQRISAYVGLTAKAIAYRISNMEKKGVIQNYRVNINNSILGYEFYKVFLRLQPGNERKLFEWLKEHPHVFMFLKPIGTSDYEFEFVAKQGEFWDIIEEFSAAFADKIMEMDTFNYKEEYKFHYLPRIKPDKIL